MRNKTHQAFSVKARIRSFRHAIDGIFELVQSEHNARVHLAASCIVIILGLTLSISRFEWLALVLVILLVWVTEALNTSIECLCDLVSPEYHPLVKKSKDIAAAAVLFSSFGAVVIGLIIFIPHILF